MLFKFDVEYNSVLKHSELTTEKITE